MKKRHYITLEYHAAVPAAARLRGIKKNYSSIKEIIRYLILYPKTFTGLISIYRPQYGLALIRILCYMQYTLSLQVS